MTDIPSQPPTKSRSQLQVFHYRAIELRYQGLTYQEVADKLVEEFKRKFSERTVRDWFAVAGRLRSAYLDYAGQETERRRQEMRVNLGKLVGSVPLKLQALIERKVVKFDPKTGEYTVTDRDQLDSLTLGALKLLADLADLSKHPNDTHDDPTDRFFERAEQELAADGGPDEQAGPTG